MPGVSASAGSLVIWLTMGTVPVENCPMVLNHQFQPCLRIPEYSPPKPWNDCEPHLFAAMEDWAAHVPRAVYGSCDGRRYRIDEAGVVVEGWS